MESWAVHVETYMSRGGGAQFTILGANENAPSGGTRLKSIIWYI